MTYFFRMEGVGSPNGGPKLNIAPHIAIRLSMSHVFKYKKSGEAGG